MASEITPKRIETEGMFTVSRVKPVRDDAGNVTLLTCG